MVTSDKTSSWDGGFCWAKSAANAGATEAHAPPWGETSEAAPWESALRDPPVTARGCLSDCLARAPLGLEGACGRVRASRASTLAERAAMVESKRRCVEASARRFLEAREAPAPPRKRSSRKQHEASKQDPGLPKAPSPTEEPPPPPTPPPPGGEGEGGAAAEAATGTAGAATSHTPLPGTIHRTRTPAAVVESGGRPVPSHIAAFFKRFKRE